MPGRTRLYSEFLAQDSELDSSVIHNSANRCGRAFFSGLVCKSLCFTYRVRLTPRLVGGNARGMSDTKLTRPSFTTSGTTAPSVSPDLGPSFKRHKTMGLNARFDRMIERVNLTLQDPQTPSATSSRQGQVRARSAGSSSISSGYDVPKTPMDAYGGLQEGRLGHKFSVIKMKSSSGGKIGAYYREAEGCDGSSDVQFEQSDRARGFMISLSCFVLTTASRSTKSQFTKNLYRPGYLRRFQGLTLKIRYDVWSPRPPSRSQALHCPMKNPSSPSRIYHRTRT
jgi:hypothetical protein